VLEVEAPLILGVLGDCVRLLIPESPNFPEEDCILLFDVSPSKARNLFDRLGTPSNSLVKDTRKMESVGTLGVDS
jgi:hypothetical protein